MLSLVGWGSCLWGRKGASAHLSGSGQILCPLAHFMPLWEEEHVGGQECRTVLSMVW